MTTDKIAQRGFHSQPSTRNQKPAAEGRPFRHRGINSLEKSIAFLPKSIVKSITKCHAYSDTLAAFHEQK
jgi:hypothetical protein